MGTDVEYVVVGLGALGSSAAYHLAKGGHSVLGLEQFEFGHQRGASHDTSRILRHSYHTADYVGLTHHAYTDWAVLEADSGQRLVTQVGGLDLFPAGGTVPIERYAEALRAQDISFEVLETRHVHDRWPMFNPPDGTLGLYQSRGSIVPAARGTAAIQACARNFGADLRDRSLVTSVRDLGSSGIEVQAAGETFHCRKVIVCADAWTNQVLAELGHRIPLRTTLEQVTYFAPAAPENFAPERMPLWIWFDDPCYYGFPTYGEATVKAAADGGGAEVTGDTRGFEPDGVRLEELSRFVATLLPGAGAPVRSKTCLYTMPPDRDFVLGPVPGYEAVLVGVGAGHSFKFAPTIGRVLAELAVDGCTDINIEPFRLNRSWN